MAWPGPWHATAWWRPPCSPWLRLEYGTGNREYYAGEAAVDDLPEVVHLVVNVEAKDERGGPGVWDFPPAGRRPAVTWGGTPGWGR